MAAVATSASASAQPSAAPRAAAGSDGRMARRAQTAPGAHSERTRGAAKTDLASSQPPRPAPTPSSSAARTSAAGTTRARTTRSSARAAARRCASRFGTSGSNGPRVDASSPRVRDSIESSCVAAALAAECGAHAAAAAASDMACGSRAPHSRGGAGKMMPAPFTSRKPGTSDCAMSSTDERRSRPADLVLALCAVGGGRPPPPRSTIVPTVMASSHNSCPNLLLCSYTMPSSSRSQTARSNMEVPILQKSRAFKKNTNDAFRMELARTRRASAAPCEAH